MYMGKVMGVSEAVLPRVGMWKGGLRCWKQGFCHAFVMCGVVVWPEFFCC